MRIYKNIALTVNLQIIFVNESLLKLICSNLQIIKNKTVICTEKEDEQIVLDMPAIAMQPNWKYEKQFADDECDLPPSDEDEEFEDLEVLSGHFGSIILQNR